MKPYTRELISDRRQPMLKWSAVFAGATIAVALWVLLQMFGMGVGLATIDVGDHGNLRSIGIGTTVWTMIAPLIAMFVGGFIGGRLATTFDQKVGAMHGFIIGALSSLVGVVATVSVVSMLASGALQLSTGDLVVSDDITVDPNLRANELQEATRHTGKVLLGAGISLLLGLGSAVAGGGLASRRWAKPRRHRTAEVPVVPPPGAPPVDAPHADARVGAPHAEHDLRSL